MLDELLVFIAKGQCKANGYCVVESGMGRLDWSAWLLYFTDDALIVMQFAVFNGELYQD